MMIRTFLHNHGAIGGWSASIEIDGERIRVPAKIVGDGHGAGMAVAFDSRDEAQRAATRFARLKLQQLRNAA